MSVYLRPAGDATAAFYGNKYLNPAEIQRLREGEELDVLCNDGMNYRVDVIRNVEGQGQLHFPYWAAKYDYRGSLLKLYLAPKGTFTAELREQNFHTVEEIAAQKTISEQAMQGTPISSPKGGVPLLGKRARTQRVLNSFDTTAQQQPRLLKKMALKSSINHQQPQKLQKKLLQQRESFSSVDSAESDSEEDKQLKAGNKRDHDSEEDEQFVARAVSEANKKRRVDETSVKSGVKGAEQCASHRLAAPAFEERNFYILDEYPDAEEAPVFDYAGLSIMSDISLSMPQSPLNEEGIPFLTGPTRKVGVIDGQLGKLNEARRQIDEAIRRLEKMRGRLDASRLRNL